MDVGEIVMTQLHPPHQMLNSTKPNRYHVSCSYVNYQPNSRTHL